MIISENVKGLPFSISSEYTHKKNNNTNFASIMSMRIFVDGKLSTSEEQIKNASNLLLCTLAGHYSKNQTAINIMSKYAKYDKDYSLKQAIRGYPKNFLESFRSIVDKTKAYFVTGPDALALDKISSKVGMPKQIYPVEYINLSQKTKDLSHKFIKKAMEFIKETIHNKTLSKDNNLNKDPEELLTIDVYTNSDSINTKHLSLSNITFKKGSGDNYIHLS